MNEIEKIWNVYYNNSQMREGILSWYDLKEQSLILEWNPEDGALTGWLSANCKYLTCVVSKADQKILLSERFEDRNNIELVTVNAIKNDLNRLYDYIIAINPFDSNISNDEMFQIFHMWNKRLNERGKVLLVMDNMFGIHKNMGIKNVDGREIDKNTLQEILRKIFKFTKFYYIYPDFIFPQMVYTDKRLPDYGVIERIMPYAKNIEQITSNFNLIYRMAAHNDLLATMANSFMIECSNLDDLCGVISANITSERDNYALITKIRENGVVEKVPMNRSSNEHIQKLENNMKALNERGIRTVPFNVKENVFKMPFINATILTEHLKHLIKNGTEEFLYLMERFYETILQSSEMVSEEDNSLLLKYGNKNWGPILQNAYIELSPLNCFYIEEEFVFFDQEYVYLNYPAKYILFRSISHLYTFDDTFSHFISLERLKKIFELEDLWETFEIIEQNFLCEVRGSKKNKDFFELLTLNNQYKYIGRRENLDIKQIIYLFSGSVKEKIVLWGTGHYFDEFMRLYGDLFQVAYAVDSNKELWDMQKKGINIKNPETLLQESVRVIIACKDKREIQYKLMKMGISNYRNFVLREDN